MSNPTDKNIITFIPDRINSIEYFFLKEKNIMELFIINHTKEQIYDKLRSVYILKLESTNIFISNHDPI